MKDDQGDQEGTSLIELRGLTKTFVTKQGPVEALKDINLTIQDGDIFGIIGVSGAGKSTLVRCINLLERPTSGQVWIDGVDVTAYSGRRLSDLRSQIGMIFQDFSLFAQRSILKNVTFPLELHHAKADSSRARACELLELVGLAGREQSYPAQLSGGQQQRVAIARALANNPKYLLCDEATSALDSLSTESILELLRDINRKLRVTMIIITHEMKVVASVCNKVAVIDGAQIVEQGSVESVFSAPAAAITRHLIEASELHPEALTVPATAAGAGAGARAHA